MEQYTEVAIPLLDERKDIIIARLTDLGYDGIWDKGNELIAYILKDNFNHKLLYDTLAEYQMENSFSVQDLKQQNWNEEWEKNYDPILVDDRVYVRSPFHDAKPQMDYEVIIQPQMSFGTGHHETTQLMIEMMLTMNLNGTSLLDMGTGTGVLAFLARKMGASHVDGIDYDRNSVENAIDNLKYNAGADVNFLEGSYEAIPDNMYDVVLSNITKNINVSLLPHLSKHVSNDGKLVLAGFLNFDLKEVDQLVTELGFTLERNISKGDWECLMYTKLD
jgi:ribosomal protein L11 methyltransferase